MLSYVYFKGFITIPKLTSQFTWIKHTVHGDVQKFVDKHKKKTPHELYWSFFSDHVTVKSLSDRRR